MFNWGKSNVDEKSITKEKLLKLREIDAPTSVLKNLTDDQYATFVLFKEWIVDEKIFAPEFDDWYMLRFLKAKSYKLDKAQKMFRAWMEKWNYHKVRTILSIDMTNLNNRIPTVLTENFTGITKDFWPIKVQKYHPIDKDNIFNVSYDEWWDFNFLVTEKMMNVVFPVCSKIAGRRIDKFVIIMDLEDCDLNPLIWDSKLRKYFLIPGELGQECYPELLGQLWIINAPSLFSTLWSMFSVFQSQETLNRTKIFGKNYHEEMHSLLGKENQPVFLGGTVDDWENQKMPWSNLLEGCSVEKTFYPSGEKRQSDPQYKSEQFDYDKY